MAETTVFPGGNEAQPPPIAAKRPVGRPRNDGQPAGTAPITAVAEPEDFFLMLPGLTPEQWQFRTLYLYRLYPITDRRGAGQPVYLNKFSEVVDRDRIMRDYGSGIYKLELLETLPNEKGKKIAATLFQIMNQEYPPRVPAGEWVNDPRNADWEWCRPKLGPGTSNNGNSTADDIASAVTKVYQTMHPGSDQKEQVTMVTAFMEMAKSNQLLMTQLMDPGRQLQMITALLALLPKPPEPKENKSDDILMTFLMKRLEAMEKQLAERPREKSPIEWLLENDEMMERARKLFGKGSGNAASPEAGWVGVIDKAVDKLAPAAAQIAVGIATNMMRPPQQQTQRPPQQTALPAPSTQQPTTAAPPSQAPTTTTEPQPNPQDPEQMKAMELWNKYGNAIMQALPFMIDKFKEDEPDGYECRDWFQSPKRFGNVIWEGLRTDVGVEGFITIAKQFPDVWKSFQPEEKFRAFMVDFFTPIGEERPEYLDEDPDEEFTRPRDVK